MKSKATRLCFALLAVAVVLAAGCNDSSSSSSAQREFQYFNPSGGGNLRILNHGGRGIGGDGGDGGYFEIYAYAAGDIRVLDYGTVDSSFQIPSRLPELGSNPRTISASTTIQPDVGATILGDNGTTVATGLRVLAGVTLTLRPNYDSDSNGSLDTALVNFEDGVIIEGTLATGPVEPGMAPVQVVGPLDTSSLDMDAANFLITASGRVETQGENGGVGEVGGNGGDVDLYSEGAFINRGAIMTYGGNGTDGGDGGDLDVLSEYYAIYNTGPVSTYGGSGSTGGGGDGGYIDMETNDTGGGMHNSGNLISRGGAGATSGGDAGYVDLIADYVGELASSGDIDASGGNATVSGSGGDGDSIYMYAGGSNMRVTGNLVSRGGNGAGEGSGGDGEYIELYLDDEDYIEGEYSVEGLFIGANMDARGGDGMNGGNGGDILIYPDQDTMYAPGTQPVILAGYALIDGSGGDGSVNGGSAYDSTMYIYNDGADNYNGDYYVGNIEIRVPIDFSGGNGGTGSGGYGAELEIYNYEFHGTELLDRVVHNMAGIDLSGGNGATFGGPGGTLYMYDYFHTVNEGNVDVSGGNGGTGGGGNGGWVEIYSDDVCESRGDIDASGGNATTGPAGAAEHIEVAGRVTICHGDLDVSGGDSAGAAGGSGGYIEIWSTDTVTESSGSVNAAGGGGTTAGTPGEVWLDGIQLDLTGGVGVL